MYIKKETYTYMKRDVYMKRDLCTSKKTCEGKPQRPPKELEIISVLNVLILW